MRVTAARSTKEAGKIESDGTKAEKEAQFREQRTNNEMQYTQQRAEKTVSEVAHNNGGIASLQMDF